MRRRASSPIHAFPPSRPLGLPFLGRSNELNRLSEAMTEGAGAGVVVVRGPAGAGKSRLARYLSDHDEHRRGRRVSFVTCRNGEPASAVQARAERRLGVLPGDLFTALRDEHCLLVVDDLHHLTASATEHLLAPIDGAPLRGRVLLVSRDLPALQRDLRPLVLDLGGLDDDAARALWEHMESAHGPTRQGTCDHALQMSRGLPLALRRAYAEAVFGPDAWGREALSPAAAAVLDALTVLGRPAGPGAIATMLTEADAFGPAHDPAGAPEGAIELADGFHALVARQLIDQLDDGRFATHVALRGDLLDALPTPRRRRLERAAAARVGTSTAGHGGQDHSLGVLDPVDRVCAEVRHLLAAGDWSEAAHCLLIRREALFEGGGGGELEGLVELLRRCAGAEHQLELAMLDQLQAELAADRGDVSRALALDPGTDPVATAALRFRAGQVREARNTLEDLLAACAEDASPSTGALSPDIRCRAAVHLAELVLADGDPDAAERIVATAFARDHAAVSEPLRARLHLALAAIARHRGHVDSARAALARAAGAGRLAPALRARIEIQRAACLIDEGRLRDAHDALTRAEHDARAVDAGAVADEARLHASRLAALRGDTERAIELLRALARAH
ncbi:AAA family ATPase, partial [Haliangium sp.]|uniref:AAA family ATPase n=1 Tax=Haliangium sp. TaxID=2663208 RepID=UPI003D0DDE72